MDRTRVALLVWVDLDAVPGVFHTHESAQEHVQAVLERSLGHYNPETHLAAKV
jgi:hypothetical protein